MTSLDHGVVQTNQGVSIQPARAEDLPTVRVLLREYVAWTGVDLCFQNFERELAELPGDYSPPRGILLVARMNGEIGGCVAAHEWSAEACEMKRLFVRDSLRGSGAGRALVNQVIEWAKATGYRELLLDTLPVMEQAQKMYARFGFEDVPPYRANPVPGARYMRLNLYGGAGEVK